MGRVGIHEGAGADLFSGRKDFSDHGRLPKLDNIRYAILDAGFWMLDT
jgi:hypothetical protein